MWLLKILDQTFANAELITKDSKSTVKLALYAEVII